MGTLGPTHITRSQVFRQAREFASTGRYEDHRSLVAALHEAGVQDASVVLRDGPMRGQIDRLCAMARQGDFWKRGA